MFNQKSILITGGSGTFGKAFLRKIATEQPSLKRVVIYSRDEVKQSKLAKEFPASSQVEFVIGDVRDAAQLKRAMQGIDFVVHAAALKQIPTAERNPEECVKTNILGAMNLIECALESRVRKVVALSTDKAVSPVNLYGATKLTADKLVTAANGSVGTPEFSVVRYGNVLGSRGSLVWLLRRAKKNGEEEFPITDERMTRFWMTIDQAVDFVMTAFQRMQGGEIFIPKIPSMKSIDMITALAPELKLKTIGLRPGEKLHEELCRSETAHLTTEFKDHFVVRPSVINNGEKDYSKNALGEQGQTVPEGFSYNSRDNSDWLSKDELVKLLS